MRPIVVINSHAAAAYRSGAAAIDVIGRGYAGHGIAADIRIVSPADFASVLGDALRRERPVVIGGGDGSVSTAIQLFARTGIPVGVLPLGTYNLLAQDLGMSADLGTAVDQLAGGHATHIDLGRTGGTYFHTLAGLGFFARAARERASIRKRLPGVRALAAMIAALRSVAFQGKLDVEIDDGRDKRLVRTPALLVTNNCLDAATWRRPRLDAGMLELPAANGSIRYPLVQGGFAAIRGTWRQHPGVETWIAPRIELRFRRPRVFVSLDGELSRRGTPLAFEIVPGALVCLRGAPLDAL